MSACDAVPRSSISTSRPRAIAISPERSSIRSSFVTSTRSERPLPAGCCGVGDSPPSPPPVAAGGDGGAPGDEAADAAASARRPRKAVTARDPPGPPPAASETAPRATSTDCRRSVTSPSVTASVFLRSRSRTFSRSCERSRTSSKPTRPAAPLRVCASRKSPCSSSSSSGRDSRATSACSMCTNVSSASSRKVCSNASRSISSSSMSPPSELTYPGRSLVREEHELAPAAAADVLVEHGDARLLEQPQREDRILLAEPAPARHPEDDARAPEHLRDERAARRAGAQHRVDELRDRDGAEARRLLPVDVQRQEEVVHPPDLRDRVVEADRDARAEHGRDGRRRVRDAQLPRVQVGLKAAARVRGPGAGRGAGRVRKEQGSPQARSPRRNGALVERAEVQREPRVRGEQVEDGLV